MLSLKCKISPSINCNDVKAFSLLLFLHAHSIWLEFSEVKLMWGLAMRCCTAGGRRHNTLLEDTQSWILLPVIQMQHLCYKWQNLLTHGVDIFKHVTWRTLIKVTDRRLKFFLRSKSNIVWGAIPSSAKHRYPSLWCLISRDFMNLLL